MSFSDLRPVRVFAVSTLFVLAQLLPGVAQSIEGSCQLSVVALSGGTLTKVLDTMRFSSYRSKAKCEGSIFGDEYAEGSCEFEQMVCDWWGDEDVRCFLCEGELNQRMSDFLVKALFERRPGVHRMGEIACEITGEAATDLQTKCRFK